MTRKITVHDALENERRSMGRPVSLVTYRFFIVEDAAGEPHEILALVYDYKQNDHGGALLKRSIRISTFIDGKLHSSSIVA